LIEVLVDRTVASAEVIGVRPTLPPLYPEEAEQMARSMPWRRAEYAAGRACARVALVRLDVKPAPILSGAGGEPLWPQGLVGSLTHCEGYAAAVVARAGALAGLGIDAEPNQPLPTGVLADIATPDERAGLARLTTGPRAHWDRLLFSAKEAVFKAWYPMTRMRLPFDAASVTVDPHRGRFGVQLASGGPPLGGRWTVTGGLILCAVSIPQIGLGVGHDR
jgi:4'-phosphopantetheinyl transferase EntD